MKTETIKNYTRQAIIKEQLETLKRNSIKTSLMELDQCKELITKLKKEDISSMSKSELYQHNKKLDQQLRKRNLLLQKLLELGYNADKRGRPKKYDNEKYKSIHTRMACYFTKDNTIFLKDLKEQGKIKNISAFLNELLTSYFASSKVGVDN